MTQVLDSCCAAKVEASVQSCLKVQCGALLPVLAHHSSVASPHFSKIDLQQKDAGSLVIKLTTM